MKTKKLVTCQQRMAEQLRVFSWPDSKVLTAQERFCSMELVQERNTILVCTFNCHASELLHA